ncbi:MAG: hypothetical protein IOD15_06330 [Phycisphaerales bacterium]|jgi:hypothetical protein|nr:hypothetical protein [Phycisphaerales bacterium]
MKQASGGSVNQARRRATANRLATAAVLAGLAWAGAGLAGCTQQRKEIGDGPVYPGVPQQQTLDVQVRREGTRIFVVNTTARALPAGRLWVNQWWARPFDGLGVGQSAEFDLLQFTDRYGKAFRAGGFFGVDIPDRLVQVQLEPIAAAAASGDAPAAPASLLGLVVIRSTEGNPP